MQITYFHGNRPITAGGQSIRAPLVRGHVSRLVPCLKCHEKNVLPYLNNIELTCLQFSSHGLVPSCYAEHAVDVSKENYSEFLQVYNFLNKN